MCLQSYFSHFNGIYRVLLFDAVFCYVLDFVCLCVLLFFFFFQAEDGIRDLIVTGVQTCALPICPVGLPLQSANCAAWWAAPEGDRTSVIQALSRSIGGSTPYGRGTTLPDARVQIGRASCRERV